MAFTLLDSTTATGSAANIVVTYPGGAPASGDLLVLGVNSNLTCSTPAGWTLSTNASFVGGQGAYVFWKIAGGAEPGSVTVPNGASNTSISFRRYSGAQATPLDSAANSHIDGTGASSTPALTTSSMTAGDLVLAYAMLHAGSAAATSPVWTGGPTNAATAGFVGGINNSSEHFIGEILSAAGGAVSPSCSWSGATFPDRYCIAIGFKASAGAPATLLPQQLQIRIPQTIHDVMSDAIYGR